MGVASGCGEQEVGVASGSGRNLWVRLLGVVVRRYIDFLILLIPTPLVSRALASPRFRVSDPQISARSSKNQAQGVQWTPVFLWRNARRR